MRGRKLRTKVLKVSLSWRRASAAMVSKTMEDLPEPETPVKMVSWRLGMRSETSFRLFSRAPRISMYSWVTIVSWSQLIFLNNSLNVSIAIGGQFVTRGLMGPQEAPVERMYCKGE